MSAHRQIHEEAGRMLGCSAGCLHSDFYDWLTMIDDRARNRNNVGINDVQVIALAIETWRAMTHTNPRAE